MEAAITMPTSTNYFWIGINDLAAEGTFQYATGGDLVYTNWNAGEPNNSGDEDCVEFYNGLTAWNDRPCNVKWPSICEIV